MQFWGVTDPGCVRPQNQDTFQMEQLDRNTLLCIVCDGMGGAKSGNVASSLATDVFVQEVRRVWKAGMSQSEIDRMMEGAVKLANFTVYDQGQQFAEFSGMGTTLVAVLVQNMEATIINVGDSRAYGVNQNGIRRLTVDHSLVQVMIDRGDLTPEQAKTYPGKNYITRAIGTESVVQGDLYHLDLERGDCLLLCSDGLSNMLDDQELLFEVVHGVNKQHCCQRLLEIAKNRGAPDNVTSVLVQI
ncbi:MAG: Stp1/IreP family PP2C-type Ser/Thr phosphatase [Ruminococcaceae bacterium]|nr:Stp1/IreP family PP2C-type Ser/Thr phosphatase [Oscillospiraceae bacterium]